MRRITLSLFGLICLTTFNAFGMGSIRNANPTQISIRLVERSESVYVYYQGRKVFDVEYDLEDKEIADLKQYIISANLMLNFNQGNTVTMNLNKLRERVEMDIDAIQEKKTEAKKAWEDKRERYSKHYQDLTAERKEVEDMMTWDKDKLRKFVEKLEKVRGLVRLFFREHLDKYYPNGGINPRTLSYDIERRGSDGAKQYVKMNQMIHMAEALMEGDTLPARKHMTKIDIEMESTFGPNHGSFNEAMAFQKTRKFYRYNYFVKLYHNAIELFTFHVPEREEVVVDGKREAKERQRSVASTNIGGKAKAE